MIDANVYDRLLNRLGQLRGKSGEFIAGEIAPASPAYTRALPLIRDELGIVGQRQVRALYELADEARKAVNAARRYNGTAGELPTVGVQGLPCPDRPGGRCGEEIQYSGVVVVSDPTTGVTSRVPFSFRSDTPLNRSAIEQRAVSQISSVFASRGYDKGGRVQLDRDPTTTTVLTSITGRDS